RASARRSLEDDLLARDDVLARAADRVHALGGEEHLEARHGRGGLEVALAGVRIVDERAGLGGGGVLGDEAEDVDGRRLVDAVGRREELEARLHQPRVGAELLPLDLAVDARGARATAELDGLRSAASGREEAEGEEEGESQSRCFERHVSSMTWW